jgi:hypothetical protein
VEWSGVVSWERNRAGPGPAWKAAWTQCGSVVRVHVLPPAPSQAACLRGGRVGSKPGRARSGFESHERPFAGAWGSSPLLSAVWLVCGWCVVGVFPYGCILGGELNRRSDLFRKQCGPLAGPGVQLLRPPPVARATSKPSLRTGAAGLANLEDESAQVPSPAANRCVPPGYGVRVVHLPPLPLATAAGGGGRSCPRARGSSRAAEPYKLCGRVRLPGARPGAARWVDDGARRGCAAIQARSMAGRWSLKPPIGVRSPGLVPLFV